MPPLTPARTSAFKKGLQQCKKRGYDMDTARVVMGQLINRKMLDPKYKDHELKGEWMGHRECHLEPDWLLVYRLEGDTIIFECTGTHSDLFG